MPCLPTPSPARRRPLNNRTTTCVQIRGVCVYFLSFLRRLQGRAGQQRQRAGESASAGRRTRRRRRRRRCAGLVAAGFCGMEIAAHLLPDSRSLAHHRTAADQPSDEVLYRPVDRLTEQASEPWQLNHRPKVGGASWWDVACS